MTEILYLNGQYIPRNQAMIAVDDRGFRFGDGLFETIALIQGVPFQWDFHLQRLTSGLKALRIESLHMPDWQTVAREIISRNNLDDGFLRLSVSRGSGSIGYLPTGNMPTVLMEALPLRPKPTTPWRVMLSQYQRATPDIWPTACKTAQGLTSTLALLEAKEKGADESILLNAHGQIAECASANLFWITDGQLFTPSLNSGCLNGSTRHAVMQLTEVTETLAPLDAFINAEATFATNAAIAIQPLQSLVGERTNWKPDHPHILSLQTAFQAMKAAVRWSANA